MGENPINVIEISPSSSEKENKKVFHYTNKSSSLEDSETPIRPILCLKNAHDVKRFEETEECFILDFDPFDPIDISNPSVSAATAAANNAAPDFVVLSEKGQVACRDFPHSRHLCLKFPFKTTSHESYCEQCYCYVCDTPAPCLSWTNPKPAHCHASEQDGNWKDLRIMMKQRPEAFD